MNSPILLSGALLVGATLLIASTTAVEARGYYRGPRGGEAYVGARRAYVSGPNRSAYVGPRRAYASGPHGTAYARRPLPRGYIATLPGPYRRVMYRGYNAYYVNGVYYRPVVYDGRTVWVVVR